MFIFLFAVFIIIAALFIYCLIERQVLITRRQDIYLESLPLSFDGLRILQISDLHHRKFGKDQSRIIKRAEKIQPDIIVITGDLISRDERDFTSAGSFCKALSAIAPVYFSMGNHELDLPEKVRDTYLETLRCAGVVVLLNEIRSLYRGEHSIAIAGASLDISVYHDENFCYNSLNLYSGKALEKDLGVRQSCTILLAHNPLIFNAYNEWKADLVLSGHVHGGVIRLLFIGGLLSPERRFFPAYTHGLYYGTDTQLYVSAGLGKLRLWNTPEVNLLTLHSSENRK